MQSSSVVIDVQTAPKRSFFASGIAIVLYVASVRIVLYLLAAPHYGYFRDELYYFACGEHPAWGYVDQPPLIGWVAWLLEHTIGTLALGTVSATSAGRRGHTQTETVSKGHTFRGAVASTPFASPEEAIRPPRDMLLSRI
jgi:hypothetical protein